MTEHTAAGGAKGPAAYRAKLKRLLDLVVLLLDARRPLTFDEIRDQFPEYKTAKPDAGKRTFERDKTDLLELGVPLEWVPPGGGAGDDGSGDDSGDDWGEGGYTIRRRAFALPPIQLSPEEAALIYLAASAARSGVGLPYLDSASLALRKLSFDLPAGRPGAPPPVLVHLAVEGAADPVFARRLEQLHEAVHGRKRVHISYRAAPPPLDRATAAGTSEGEVTERDVDPYGLLYREGAWVVVGHCHLRRDVRTFRVDRIVSLRPAGRPKTPDFELPAGFSLAEYGTRSPWRFQSGRAADVTLEVARGRRFVADEDFGPDAVREPAEDGGVQVRFRCANLGFLRERVMAGGGDLRVVAPAWLRNELAGELRATLRRYQGRAS